MTTAHCLPISPPAGKLPSSDAELYTCPAFIAAEVVSVRVVNTGGGTNLTRIYLKRADGVEAHLIRVNLETGCAALDVGRLPMRAGDAIWGVATGADQVEYTLGVYEERLEVA